MKVLVVDDAALARQVLADGLEAGGHEVIDAKSGHEALRQLARNPDVGVVVTDQEMPQMTGTELYRECRRTIGPKTPPFILFTASNDIEAMKEAKLLGFRDVLVKPADQERLLGMLALITLERESAS